MIEIGPEDIARVCNGELIGLAGGGPGPGFPLRAVADSRQVGPGDLFLGLPGDNANGSDFAEDALAAGAWGVVVDREAARRLAGATASGWAIAVDEPISALACLAGEWRRRLNGGRCKVVGITGSVGKTSTKDILIELLKGHLRVQASPQNYNTEIGLPLAILSARADCQCLVLEMAMRGPGQIGELARIAQPTVGLITNVGEVHLELLGTIEAVAEAKAELIAELPAGETCIVPADAEMLRPHWRPEVHTISFSDDTGQREAGGLERAAAAAEGTADVRLRQVEHLDGGTVATVAVGSDLMRVKFNFQHHHNLVNATAAIACAHALGLAASSIDGRDVEVAFCRLRGELIEAGGGIAVINDCYNANPVSMRAALDHLSQCAERRGSERMVAILGEMAELGPREAEFHRQVGIYAARAGVGLLVAVGGLGPHYVEGFDGAGEAVVAADAQEASAQVANMLREGDLVLLKGSRSVGLELVAEGLA